MRLTDRPRMLSEIRPDITWPEKLQEVMDRGLSRDADERYQSAAQFGRDFAEAVSGMPSVAASVAASEGATMVIGAANVAAAAAKTKPVPATRVAGRDDAKSPARASAAAPAAVQKKSNMIPMAVGGVAVVIAGFFGVKQFTGGGTPAAADSSLVASAPETKAPESAPSPTPETVTPPSITTGGGTTPMSQPMNPGTSTSRPEKQAPAPSQPEPVDAAPIISTWRPRVERIDMEIDSVGGARVARGALRELEPLMADLTGAQRDEALYVSMVAYYNLGNDQEFCRAARAVRASRFLSAADKSLAADLIAANDRC